MENKTVPQENPIILIGQRFPSNASYPYLVAMITNNPEGKPRSAII